MNECPTLFDGSHRVACSNSSVIGQLSTLFGQLLSVVLARLYLIGARLKLLSTFDFQRAADEKLVAEEAQNSSQMRPDQTSNVPVMTADRTEHSFVANKPGEQSRRQVASRVEDGAAIERESRADQTDEQRHDERLVTQLKVQVLPVRDGADAEQENCSAKNLVEEAEEDVDSVRRMSGEDDSSLLGCVQIQSRFVFQLIYDLVVVEIEQKSRQEATQVLGQYVDGQQTPLEPTIHSHGH